MTSTWLPDTERGYGTVTKAFPQESKYTTDAVSPGILRLISQIWFVVVILWLKWLWKFWAKLTAVASIKRGIPVQTARLVTIEGPYNFVQKNRGMYVKNGYNLWCNFISNICS